MRKASKRIRKYALGGEVENLDTTDSLSTSKPTDPVAPVAAKPTKALSPAQMLKQKYTSNPYLVGNANRYYWATQTNREFPLTGGNVGQAIKDAAKFNKVDPALLYASAMEEGMSGAIDSKNWQNASQAYVNFEEANPKLAEQFPVDGFYNYGLDQFAGQVPGLIKKGYLPAGFEKNVHSFDAVNEKDEKIKAAAFNTDANALMAKSAMMRQAQDQLNSYSKSKGYNLTPEQQEFFLLANYNGGQGNMQKMLDSYNSQGYLKNNDFLNPNFTPSNYGGIYKNVQARIQAAKMLRNEHTFKYGGSIQKYPDGGEIAPYPPAQLLGDFSAPIPSYDENKPKVPYVSKNAEVEAKKQIEAAQKAANRIKLVDNRKVNPATGLPFSKDKAGTKSISVDPDVIATITKHAKAQGLNPYDALAIAYQESGFGAAGTGLGEVKDYFPDQNVSDSFNEIDERKINEEANILAKALKDKFAYANRLGYAKKGEDYKFQAYNGYGKIIPRNGEKAYYGIPISKENPLDMSKNPAYGKTVLSLRQILQTNPEIAKIVNTTQAFKGVYKYGGTMPKKPKYEFGTPDPIGGINQFQPTGTQVGNNWNIGNSTVSINPNASQPLMKLDNNTNPTNSQGNIVPITTSYVDDYNAQQQSIADQISNKNQMEAIEMSKRADTVEMAASSGIAAINSFFAKQQAGKADRTNRRNAIMQQVGINTINPYAEGTGSQAIMKNGGKIGYGENGLSMQGGEQMQILGGGNVKPISASDHSNPMFEFSGNTHDEGGIGVQYGQNLAEVEDKEVGWVDQEGGLNIFGKMKLPGTNQTFRKTAQNIAEEEKKVDQRKSKYLNTLTNAKQTNAYQESAISTAKVMFKSLDKQSKEIAEKKEALASYQNLILAMTDQMAANKKAYGSKIPAIPKFELGGELDGPGDGDDISLVRKAIAQFESGANYNAIGVPVTKGMYKGQRAIGKYQIMEDNVRSWGKAATGRDITVAEFIKDPALQDQVAEYQMKQISKTHSNPADIASIWFTGKPAGKAVNVIDDNGTSGNQYVDAVMKIYSGFGGKNTTASTGINTGTPSAASQLNAKKAVTTADVMNYKPVYGETSGGATSMETQYGSAFKTPTAFNDKVNIGNGDRVRGAISPLAIEQIAPELLTMATNRREPVYQLGYQPELQQTFDVSYQLGRNENQSTFNQVSKIAESTGNIEVLSQLAAQKYQADQAYNNQEVQGNAQQRLQTYTQNIGTLNDAKVKNLALIGDQQAKQAQAKANTRLEDIAAIKSMSAKVLQNELENKTYNAYANLFKHYGFDKNGNVTFTPDKIVNKFTPGEAQQFGMLAAQQGVQAIMNGDYSRQFTKVKNPDGSTTTTETLGTNKKIQEEYKTLKDQGFNDALIGNILQAKYPETITK